MALALYIAILSVDEFRKITGMSTSIYGLVYAIVALIYTFRIPGIKTRISAAPRYLPLLLALLSFWCLIETIVPGIPVTMAALGWASYIFFIPLVYVGSELTMTDQGAAKTLRIASIGGAIIGIGAIVSALLGQSAPVWLQPLAPAAGFHSSSAGDIYLAPSIFATAEEAAEELLIALFAWAALECLRPDLSRRKISAGMGVLIVVGLFATERRTDIAVAIAGVSAMILLGHQRKRSRNVTRQQQASITRTVSPHATALVFAAAGATILISVLGASRIIPFLTSESSGQSMLVLTVSPLNPTSLVGQGTGTSTQGAAVVGAVQDSAYINHKLYDAYVQNGHTFITAEGGLTKTWLELGIIGVLLYVAIFVVVLGPLVRAFRKLDGVGRALTILTLAMGVVFLKGHQSLDDPLVQPLFWLAAGGAWGRMLRYKAAHTISSAAAPIRPTGAKPSVRAQLHYSSSD